MNSSLRIGSFLVFLALFVLALPAYGQTPLGDPKPTPTPKDEKVILERVTPFDGDVDFPEVEGWELSRKIRYPRPELGYSVNYELPAGGRVTVYVYNGGLRSIPNELTGPVAAQMRQAKAEINAAVDAGYYDSATEVSSSTVTLGGAEGNVRTLYSLYLIKVNGREMDSEIYVFPYENYFIKLRATRPKEADGPKNEAIEALLIELDKLFSH